MARTQHREAAPRALRARDLIAPHVQEPDQLVAAVERVADDQPVAQRERRDGVTAAGGDQNVAVLGATGQLGGGRQRGVELGETDESGRVGAGGQVDLDRLSVADRLMRGATERFEAVELGECGMGELDLRHECSLMWLVYHCSL